MLPDRSASDNLDFVLGATGWSKGTSHGKAESKRASMLSGSAKGYKMPHALSGGEQQRLAIARALLNEPPCSSPDEPTGNLDPETTNGILQLLHDLVQKDRTVIMATHDHHALQAYPGRVLHCSGAASKQPTFRAKSNTRGPLSHQRRNPHQIQPRRVEGYG